MRLTFPDSPFTLNLPFEPAGDQPDAIEKLLEGIRDGLAFQTLLGVTGSGKTFTVANVIQAMQRPTLVIAHNKTLAAQLYGEFKEFFPRNAVEYFVSYYDYYQPEAYVPASDTYIEKDSAINEHIEQMRLSCTKSLMERRDVVIVATVSAIYGIGNPNEYHQMVLTLRTKDKPYLDVISESINNPLRLTLGWAMIDPTTLPPSSVIILYWAGGAFLMTAKRLSEYREIVASHGKDLLARYRASFAGYTETSLTVSCFVYALASSFVLAVFLMKYRIEYLLIAPVVIALFAHYLALSMQPGSSAQKPEKLIRERGLMALVALLTALFVLLTFVNVPALEPLAGQKYISIQ